ncbi:MAG: hypothetical protein HYS05_20655, partial [Acidobacteria bacterium]|nr:hypothetical protein [Acidobacteriota bacterium]
QHALGKDEEARQLLERALSSTPRLDVVTASAAAALQKTLRAGRRAGLS